MYNYYVNQNRSVVEKVLHYKPFKFFKIYKYDNQVDVKVKLYWKNTKIIALEFRKILGLMTAWDSIWLNFQPSAAELLAIGC